MNTSFSRSRLPSGAWDTHVHVFDSTIGPFSPDSAYTPAQAPLDRLLEFGRSISKHDSPVNLLLVQPSPYGTDNSVLLSVLKTLQGSDNVMARGIAVVDVATVTDEELWELHNAGVRGIRLNKMASGRDMNVDAVIDDIRLAADRIKDLPGWKLQLYVAGRLWDDIHDTISSLPVTVLADHVGGMLASSKLPTTVDDPTVQPGFNSLVDLARRSKVFIKISALYRLSIASATGYGDVEPIITKLVETVPGQLIYGSDWPHTGDGSDRAGRKPGQVEKFRVIDNPRIVENLSTWVGDEEKWKKMTVTTPEFLFK